MAVSIRNGLAILYDKAKYQLHINNCFREKELSRKVVVKEYLTTTQHGAIPGKRIAAALFLTFLQKNGILKRTDGRLL